jgi:hypothetical protein
VLADAIIALQNKLGIGADTPGAAAEALMSNGAGASQWRGITAADIANVLRTDLATVQTINSSLALLHANPSVIFDDTVGADAKIDLDAGILRFGSTLANQFTLDVSTGVVSFTQIPLLPGSDPTLANQAARKQYVDNRKTWWSMNWFIADPSTFPLQSFNSAQKAAIPFANGQPITFTATEMWVLYNTGSATGSFTIEIRKHPFSDQNAQTILGSINMNPGSVGVRSFNNIADHTFSAADYVYPILTSRSSPAQKDVNITLIGYQTPTS